ncbi:hypothetical protein SAMN05192588_1386 [Nonlabens sp. Hel1_33_55]|uniref:hypothetical protein n=1 Tax=Nonlabens sp. Hel1_33_55 TaxID=1336802 RepID=UPI000875E0E1|nr:hypothetical protein [Nonlabens sp. Hel1_33_55]SCY14893.1 hypothetical protein SAMN05192588_1386 [Nonlabens sp. Hel1_33_55]
MKYKFKPLPILFFLILGFVTQAQVEDKESVKMKIEDKSVDWFEYDYKYLNELYRINVPSDLFNKWNSKYRYKEGKNMTYADSLKVVLNEELENASQVRKATLALAYTWDRASWSILLNKNETKAIAADMGYTYPYKFINDLRDPKIKNEQKTKILKGLKERLRQLKVEGVKDKLNAREMMKLSFQYSPGRLKVVDSILASQGSSRKVD